MTKTTDTKPLALRAIPDLVYEALRFANFAAGEGICPANDDDGRDPALFLSDYTDQTGDDDWDALAGRIRDQLAALLMDSGEGWRPIESAPKDGTVVLLYCPQGDGSPGSIYRVTVGNWESDPGGITEHRDLEGRYLGQDESDGWEGWMSWDGCFSEDTMMPTYWRPLPAPPAAGGKDGEV